MLVLITTSIVPTTIVMTMIVILISSGLEFRVVTTGKTHP